MTATKEEIARKAYDLYVKEGCQEGHCQKYWHEAEQQITQKDVEMHEAELEMRNEGGTAPANPSNDVMDPESKPSGSP